jgi:hypothetical protein
MPGAEVVSSLLDPEDEGILQDHSTLCGEMIQYQSKQQETILIILQLLKGDSPLYEGRIYDR